jgi:hypothetical protein
MQCGLIKHGKHLKTSHTKSPLGDAIHFDMRDAMTHSLVGTHMGGDPILDDQLLKEPM